MFVDDAPDKKIDTIKLFDEVSQGKYQPFTSNAVVEELIKSSEPKRTRMLDLINKYNVVVIDVDDEVDTLADTYVKEGIIPLKYRDDAVHIATASIYDLNLIVSWNFKHIVKVKTKNMVNAVNIREGYKTIDIYSPMEVIEYDE